MQVNIFNPASSETSALTIGLNIWAAVGPLLGIFFGSYLARAGQRRQWLADNKVKEWQELIGTLLTSFTTMVRCSTGTTPEERNERVRAQFAAHEVLSNRIFIGQEIRKRGIPEKWSDALKTLEKDHDLGAFGTRFGELRVLVEDGAKEDISEL